MILTSRNKISPNMWLMNIIRSVNHGILLDSRDLQKSVMVVITGSSTAWGTVRGPPRNDLCRSNEGGVVGSRLFKMAFTASKNFSKSSDFLRLWIFTFGRPEEKHTFGRSSAVNEDATKLLTAPDVVFWHCGLCVCGSFHAKLRTRSTRCMAVEMTRKN